MRLGSLPFFQKDSALCLRKTLAWPPKSALEKVAKVATMPNLNDGRGDACAGHDKATSVLALLS